mgnify:FL=1
MWEIRTYKVEDQAGIAQSLASDWEPFAATVHWVFLRRETEKKTCPEPDRGATVCKLCGKVIEGSWWGIPGGRAHKDCFFARDHTLREVGHWLYQWSRDHPDDMPLWRAIEAFKAGRMP